MCAGQQQRAKFEHFPKQQEAADGFQADGFQAEEQHDVVRFVRKNLPGHCVEWTIVGQEGRQESSLEYVVVSYI